MGTAKGILLVTDLGLKKLHKVQAGHGRLKKVVVVSEDIYAGIFSDKALRVFAYDEGVLDLGEQLVSQLPVDLIAVDVEQAADEPELLEELAEIEEEFEGEDFGEEELDSDKK